ncbi:flagellar protein FlaG [Polynucleobacter sp. AP-Ainpum-60-G11]|uniref:flagellar protein FlaG n=1 Tax=Polynucleobacter sp. AP-Ainpum-60-G11 TaxID=2576926 RepID=UPI001BFE0D79|nr:flagellar protein FlaG [Polynucleobacter sp. AP-Ainpum-60-G11]QWE27145.1 flagellar protein FlaG [Polynucleobacter sp. AP-Ainpum-60-G11]
MSTVNAGSAVASSTVMPESHFVPQIKHGSSDAEVVAKVAATVIKPSSIESTSQPSRDVVAKAAADLQNFVQSMGRNLSFSVDETTGYHVVRVVNPNTGELVRQLPSEELLKISRDFQRLNNVLVSQRA